MALRIVALSVLPAVCVLFLCLIAYADIPDATVVSPVVSYYRMGDAADGVLREVTAYGNPVSYYRMASPPNGELTQVTVAAQPVSYSRTEWGIKLHPAAVWNSVSRTLAVSTSAYDLRTGSKVTSGTGSYWVTGTSQNTVAEGTLTYNAARAQWESASVPFDFTGQFVAHVTVNSVSNSVGFRAGQGVVVVTGRVTDAYGTAVVGANVTLLNAVTNAALFTVQSGPGGVFAFDGANAVVRGTYVISATGGLRSGETSPFFASTSPYTRDVVVADNGAQALVGEYANLGKSLRVIAQNNNTMIGEMAKSVDNYLVGVNAADAVLGAVNLASLALKPQQIFDLPEHLGTMDVLLRNSETLTNKTWALAAFQTLLHGLEDVNSLTEIPEFVTDVMTSPSTANSSKDLLSYFISPQAGGVAFGPTGVWNGAPTGYHYSLAARLAQSPFYLKMLDTLAGGETGFTSFVTTGTVSPDFASDRARGYLHAVAVQAQNATPPAAASTQCPFWLPETNTSVFLTVMPDYYRYRSDQWAENTIFVAKTTSFVVGLGAGIIGPWGWAAATAGQLATDWAIDSWDCSVKEDFATTWGLLAGDYLRDLRLLELIQIKTGDFVKAEATVPYYLSNSKRNAFRTEVGNGAINFSLSDYKRVLVNATVRNSGTQDCDLGLRCENFVTTDVSSSLAQSLWNKDIVFAVASYALKQRPSAPGTEVVYNFDLPTRLKWHQMLWAKGYVMLTSYAGPWPRQYGPYYYFEGGKDNAVLPAPLRSAQKLFTTADVAEFKARIAQKQEVTLNAASPTATFTYTPSPDADNATLQVFDSFGADSCVLVTNAAGQRVGFDVTNGLDLVEFPATYTGPQVRPEEVAIPQVAGQTYTITITLTDPGLDGDDSVTFVVLEEPVRPAVVGCSPREIVQTADGGREITLCAEVAECSRQVPIENVQVSITPLVNELSEELPLDALATPASVEIDYLTAGAIAQTLFKYDVPLRATGTYQGQIWIETANAGTLTMPVTVNIFNPAVLAVEGHITCNVADGFIQTGSHVVLTAPSGSDYRWFKDNVEILGENGQTLVLGPVDEANSGTYTCVYNNGTTAVRTEPFELSVITSGSLPLASLFLATILVGVIVTTGFSLMQKQNVETQG